MTTLRKFEASDLFKFNHINLDPLTETYGIPFYMQYMSQWPSINACIDDPNGRMMGYVLGKAEGAEKLWHGHVTAVTVANEYRRMGVARRLMKSLEDASTKVYNAFFVDLFVRCSNLLAQLMYTNMKYVRYRRVVGYYSGEEDAFDMRRSLRRDKKNKSIVPREPFECTPEEVEWC